MKNIPVVPAILLLLASLSNPALAAPVNMSSVVPYADNAAITTRVRNECVKIQGQLAEFTQEYARSEGIDVALVGSVSPSDAGRVLVMRIDEAVSMGNAFIGHQKYTRISGELYENGKRIAGFQGRRNSGGGAFGGFKGSCSVLGRTVKVLGRDVAQWLRSPFDNARLGDM